MRTTAPWRDAHDCKRAWATRQRDDKAHMRGRGALARHDDDTTHRLVQRTRMESNRALARHADDTTHHPRRGPSTAGAAANRCGASRAVPAAARRLRRRPGARRPHRRPRPSAGGCDGGRPAGGRVLLLMLLLLLLLLDESAGAIPEHRPGRNSLASRSTRSHLPPSHRGPPQTCR